MSPAVFLLAGLLLLWLVFSRRAEMVWTALTTPAEQVQRVPSQTLPRAP